MKKYNKQYSKEAYPQETSSPENPIPAEAAPETLRPLTPEEQAIAARIAADQDREWETITEDSALDYSLGRWTFELPPEAKKAQDEKRFAFRWITRTKERIDEIRTKQPPARWWICNRSNTPFLAHLCDPVLGAVVREDQILVFQPWWMRDKMRAIVQGIADGKSADLTAKDGEARGAARFAASARPMGGGQETRQEIKGGDQIVYDGDLEESGLVAAEE